MAPTYTAHAGALRQSFAAWCEANDLDADLTREEFGRQLRAAVPGIKKTRHREDGTRGYLYHGLKLKPVPRDNDAETKGAGDGRQKTQH